MVNKTEDGTTCVISVAVITESWLSLNLTVVSGHGNVLAHRAGLGPSSESHDVYMINGLSRHVE